MQNINLDQFTGTTRYIRYSPLFKRVLITDGVEYLAEKAGAYWLLDAIASYLPEITKAGERFVSASLVKGDNGATLTLSLDETNRTIAQVIEYTDFPLEEITLYFSPTGEGSWVLYLPSEY